MDLNTITFYRGDEDIVVRETKDYLTSLFREQYAHALVQIYCSSCGKEIYTWKIPFSTRNR